MLEEAAAAARSGGWRPGARWARARDIIVEPRDRRTGRSSEAADHPFKAMPPDEGGAVVRDNRVVALNRHPGLVLGSTPPLGRQSVLRGGPRHKAGVTAFGSEGMAPRVTTQQSGNQNLIAAACPLARELGIVAGMAVTQARAQVPGLDIRPADPEGDRAALLRLATLIARRWCPVVMLSGEDGLFLDITGTSHLFGGEARMAQRIVRLLARLGFTAHIAVADTPGAAWAIARFATHHRPGAGRGRCVTDDRLHQASPGLRRGDGYCIVAPAAHIDSLAPLPVAALRLEPRAIDLLRRLGIDTVGQLAALPRAPLTRRFGEALIARLDQATGRLPEPLVPVIAPEPIAVVQRFAEPIATAEAIEHWLGQLMPRLITELAERGLGARAVELVADRIDGVPQRLRIGLARPTRDAEHLLKLAVRRIEEIAPGYGIDALTLHVRRADPLGAQAFTETLEKHDPDLAPLIDTLANRIGAHALWRTMPVESDVPERSVATTTPLDPPPRAAAKLKRDDVRQLDRAPDLHPWHPRWPRPVRLLRRPELLDHVLAELPDQPPKRFTWRGTTHRVVRADGPERILGEWWKRGSERHSVRDYFQVEDEAGQRFWLFRRGDGEREETGDLAWFLHGAFG